MFCTACGAAMPADAKFCPKCGAAAVARPGAVPAPAPGPAPGPVPGSAPKPAPQSLQANAIDPANPKSQAEIACGVAGLILVIYGFIVTINAYGAAINYVVGFADVVLGACALQAIAYSRKARFAQAAQMAVTCAVGCVVLGILAILVSGGQGGGTSLFVALLLAAATGFAYWRFSKL